TMQPGSSPRGADSAAGGRGWSSNRGRGEFGAGESRGRSWDSIDRSRGLALGQRQVGSSFESGWANRTGRSGDLDGRSFDGRGSERRSLDRRNLDGRSFDGRGSEGRSFDGRSSERRSSDGRNFDGRSFDGRNRGDRFDAGSDARQWSGSRQGSDWQNRTGSRRSGDWSNLASGRGKRNWSGRYHDRHRHWHRGFSVNVFLGSPWGWSPWWGGWGPGWGWGGGFGPRWGWADWWGPWGYGPMAYRTGYWNYNNPYWQEPLVLGTTVVDYSQPIILPDDAGPADSAADDPAVAMALSQFDEARELFSRGDYQAALDGARLAMRHLPTDAALHEFVSLVHFAQGNYREAAGTIHSVLAAGPGWNWQTVRSLYPDVAVYTQHLRAADTSIPGGRVIAA
ncbi:MAG: hypothetical protein WD278_05140, partial [Pirellulales bacterium]